MARPPPARREGRVSLYDAAEGTAGVSLWRAVLIACGVVAAMIVGSPLAVIYLFGRMP